MSTIERNNLNAKIKLLERSQKAQKYVMGELREEIERLREELGHSKWQTLRQLKENDRLRDALRQIADKGDDNEYGLHQAMRQMALDALREE